MAAAQCAVFPPPAPFAWAVHPAASRPPEQDRRGPPRAAAPSYGLPVVEAHKADGRSPRRRRRTESAGAAKGSPRRRLGGPGSAPLRPASRASGVLPATKPDCSGGRRPADDLADAFDWSALTGASPTSTLAASTCDMGRTLASRASSGTYFSSPTPPDRSPSTPGTQTSSVFWDVADGDPYPVDLLVSMCASTAYTAWYPQPPTPSPFSAGPGPHARAATLFSQDSPHFASYLRRLLTLMHPPPYAVARASDLVRALRARVSTQDSFAWGSHYAVTAVSLLLSTKVLDDSRHSISRWSDASGIPEAALRRMEVEFLRMVDYRVVF
ncbi:hypothetical protein DFJ74DRAFT_688467 [Hyaloraphidium curvatum]|nr:hypothetical protein DFJ74DRAFT_688467 [Hyaloraphidium curvatum]